METCKPVLVPLVVGTKLSEETCPTTPGEKKKMETIPYASTLGSVMYALLFTCPDICYAVGILSRSKEP